MRVRAKQQEQKKMEDPQYNSANGEGEYDGGAAQSYEQEGFQQQEETAPEQSTQGGANAGELEDEERCVLQNGADRPSFFCVF